MAAQRLDALVCRLPENVVMLSGHWPLIGWSFLVFPVDSTPVLIVPHCDQREALADLWEAVVKPFRFGVLSAPDPFDAIADLLKELAAGKNWRRIGYEGSFETTAPPWNAAEVAVPAALTASVLQRVFGPESLMDASGLLLDQRACKTAWEATQLRRVNEIAAMGLAVFREQVAPGATGIELVTAVEAAIMRQGTGYQGAKCVRAFAQVSTGPAETAIAYRPMEITTTRPLGDGELALLELAVVADGFWSDRTRVHVAGTPTDTQVVVFDLVLQAQVAAIATARAGVTAGAVDEAARAIIRDGGYEDEFLHVTGHGLGFKYHEPTPLLLPGSEEILRSGMVSSVEPGIYFEAMGGIRIEDNILVTESGAEVMGPAPKKLC
jgi:Xaa-Pro dipeptidase